MARLPIEVIETIVDFLRHDREALKRCCLASKSLIARTRSHLFKRVSFLKPTDIQAWKEFFPDPAKTPAIFTTHLEIIRESVAGKDFSSWIRATFINVVALEVRAGAWSYQGAFAPFHNLLPHVKSLTMGWNFMESQEVFDFICSFPSLENLKVYGAGGLLGTTGGPLSLPKLTGTISFRCYWGGEFIHRFLKLSGDLRSREIVVNIVTVGAGGLSKELVKRCSGTLERIVIEASEDTPSKSRPHSPAHNRLRI